MQILLERVGYECNIADNLGRACHVAVVEMGKDWSNLYYTLPFTPSRQLKQRTEDVRGKNNKFSSVENRVLQEIKHV